MLNHTTRLHYLILSLLAQAPFSLVEGANPYYEVVVKGPKTNSVKEGEKVNMKFTFKRDGKPLTVGEVMALSGAGYTKEVSKMFVDFTHEIATQTKKYGLFEGFKLTADLSDDHKPFVYMMSGGSHHDHKKKNKINNIFMKYAESNQASAYQQIRKKQPKNLRFKHAFDAYLSAMEEKKKNLGEDYEAVVLSSYSGDTLLIIPKKKVTTIYDFACEGTSDEIAVFWKTTLAVWQKHRAKIKASRINTGNKYAVQTVPHLHLRCELKKHLPKKKLAGWGSQKGVVLLEEKDFESVTGNPKSYTTRDGADGSSLFWQEPMVLFLGFVVLVGSILLWHASSTSEVPKRKISKRKAKKKRKKTREINS